MKNLNLIIGQLLFGLLYLCFIDAYVTPPTKLASEVSAFWLIKNGKDQL